MTRHRTRAREHRPSRWLGLAIIALWMVAVAMICPSGMNVAYADDAVGGLTPAGTTLSANVVSGAADARAPLRAASGYTARAVQLVVAAEDASGAGDAASNAANGPLLGRQLASEAQVAGEGTAIAGAGTDTPLRAAGQLAAEYGGSPADYAKMTSSNFSDGPGLYDLFETHWYENVETGERFELKTKFPRAAG